MPVVTSSGNDFENVEQFGSNPVQTGTGASGVGVPRVTVSNDSNVLATQSGTWTVQQGATPTGVANAWPVKVTDGTNTTAVKAASTAPVATDPAAVVALSPNGNQATAANQSTEITSLQLIDNPIGSVAAGTAGTNSYLTGGVYNTSAPTLTNGQQVGTQMTSDGRTKVDTQISSITSAVTASFSSKFRVDLVTTPVTLTTGSYTTCYSYSGTGYVVGISFEFNNAGILFRYTIDGENIITANSLTTLGAFQVTSNSTDRRQMGSGIVINGANIDWSQRSPWRFTSSVSISADANGGVLLSRQLTQALIYIIKET